MKLPPKADLTDQKYREILENIRRLGVDLNDIEEKFIRGSGHGGQKINKTASAVQLKHQPTGLSVKYQKYRERPLNRILGLRELLRKIERQNWIAKKEVAL